MTYRELLQQGYVHQDQLDQDVMVRGVDGEFFRVLEVGTSKDGDPADGILDHGHLYLDFLPDPLAMDLSQCECGELFKEDEVDDSYHCKDCSTEWYFKYEGTGEVAGPMSKAKVDNIAADARAHGVRYWRSGAK